MRIKEFKTLIEQIPEGAGSDKIEHYFNFFLKLKYKRSEILKMYEALFELSIKQWHTYKYLKDSLSKKIESWIFENELQSYEYYELVAGISANLGLNNVYLAILKSQNLAIKYPCLLLELKDDFGSNVTEIYNDFRNDNRNRPTIDNE